MERLRSTTAGMAPAQESLWLHQMGFTERSMRGVSLLIDKTAQYRATINDLDSTQGANAAAFANVRPRWRSRQVGCRLRRTFSK